MLLRLGILRGPEKAKLGELTGHYSRNVRVDSGEAKVGGTHGFCKALGPVLPFLYFLLSEMETPKSKTSHNLKFEEQCGT